MALFLVTGAAGFIGAAVAKRLISDGHEVITIDNLSTGYLENIPDGVTFFKGNCQDHNIYNNLPKRCFDAIFHFAGQSSGEISFTDPSYDLRTNAESTLHLLKFAISNGCSRFIYASTMSVYGIKPDGPVKESAEPKPESFYGVGKLASEHYLRIYEQYGIRSTALRLFNVYGPGQNLKNLRQGMVSIFLAQMLDNQEIHVKGSGERFRDFIYIKDVEDACIACLDNFQSFGEVINIATGIRTTVNELIDKLTALYGQPVSVTFSGNTPGDLHGIYADITKASRVLNVEPRYSIDEGLKAMLGWALENFEVNDIGDAD